MSYNPYKNLTESPEKTKPRIALHESSPASAQSFQAGHHPIPQLQRTLGNRTYGAVDSSQAAYIRR